jgi:protein-S-isoprenylcysteine O-methyltransferase Ste14
VADVALYLWGLYGLLAVVLPVVLQVRRTGSTGLKGVSGSAGSIDWLAGVGLVVAIAVGFAAPILALNDVIEPIDALDRSGLHAAGIVLFAVGLGTVVFSQQWMGRSWRIGVDESERTPLVTGGPFVLVRNPIFTGMSLVSVGLALLVPSVVSFASVAILLASLEAQTRLVEEPYLTQVHGDAYTSYASRAGRFLPGVGRLERI